jgi:hypothetical protein
MHQIKCACVWSSEMIRILNFKKLSYKLGFTNSNYGMISHIQLGLND